MTRATTPVDIDQRRPQVPSRRLDLDGWSDEDLVAVTREEDGHRALAARNELTQRYQPLVISRANRMHRGRGTRHDDVVSVAQEGLQKAIEHYDLDRDVPFAAYAPAKVRGELMRWFRDGRYSVHVPRTLHERYMQVRKAIQRIELSEGRTPGAEEVGRLLGCDADEVLEAMAVGGAEKSRAAQLPERMAVEAEDRTARMDLRRALQRLDERARTILYRRYWEGHSQREVGDELGLSQGHVSRLEREALADLREHVGPEALAVA